MQLRYSGSGSGSDGRNEISDWSLSYRYEPSDDSTDVQIGLNGMSVVRNGNQMVHTTIDPTTGTLSHIIKGDNVDMPGVLAKARVDSNWTISKKWGANSITKVENTTVGGANKRVYHNIGNTEYSAFCNGYGGSDNPKVINETATYVDVYANGSFNIQLIGDN